MPESVDSAPEPSPAQQSAGQPAAPGTLALLIAERLAASDLDEDAKAVLLTAFQDDGPVRGRMPGAYLQSVTVSGFRGIGRTARLPLTPGPGLTLVTGRNGSGKSSFAEATEIALTGDNARWRGRSDIWRRSWRNLHHGQEPQIAVELRIDGDPESATVLRTWHGDDVADSAAELDRPGHDPVPLPDLGWQEDLATYRPFLSYSELGQVIGGRPSEMYDAVASILGLEQLAAADKRLRDLAREYDAPAKEAKAELPTLLALLENTDDPRAQAARSALDGRRPDLARAAELAAGIGAGGRVTPVRPAPPIHPDRTRHRGGGHGCGPAARDDRRRRGLAGHLRRGRAATRRTPRPRSRPPPRPPRPRYLSRVRWRGTAGRGLGAGRGRAGTPPARRGRTGPHRTPGTARGWPGRP
ncbi:AAA family ATPase [Streptomyces sp. GLT-R25]